MGRKTGALITLTTDFGERDPYVASMKGVICGILPTTRILDLTHEIAAQDVLDGAFFLAGAMRYFPEGTIHVAVVDPGVGTGRHPIALYAGGQYLVCPDNGLATLYLREFPLQEARIVTNSKYFRDEVSATFHGRDIFAPVAAHLANGVPLADLGPELDALVMLNIPQTTVNEDRGRIEGEVLHVDHFGNLVTNIHCRLLKDKTPHLIKTGHYAIHGIQRTYASVPGGATLALFGSYGYLEIAINGANAHQALRLDKGGRVTVEFRPDATPQRPTSKSTSSCLATPGIKTRPRRGSPKRLKSQG